MKYKVGSLFSGCGGFDLGFLHAGFDVRWANDNNADACVTYRKNIGEIIEGDVREINPSNMGEVDVLTAGFPCQPFSNAGSRKGLNDKKGNLFESTFKFIEACKPKVVVYENVRGLLSFKVGEDKLIDLIAEELKNLGYHSKYKLLNFSHFGVPQNRIRVVLVGIKDESYTNCIFPDVEVDKNLSIENTLKGITEDYPNQNELMKLNPQALYYGKMIPEGGSWKSIAYDMLPDRWKKIRDDMPKYHYPNFFRRYSRSDIMGTITASFKPENAAVWHPIEGRIYSVREIARFQTFPDSFIFEGRNIKSKYQQIGNAVPPLFSKLLGLKIKDYLSGKDAEDMKNVIDSDALNVNQPIYKQIDKIRNSNKQLKLAV